MEKKGKQKSSVLSCKLSEVKVRVFSILLFNMVVHMIILLRQQIKTYPNGALLILNLDQKPLSYIRAFYNERISSSTPELSALRTLRVELSSETSSDGGNVLFPAIKALGV